MRSNESFNFPLGFVKYIVIVVIIVIVNHYTTGPRTVATLIAVSNITRTAMMTRVVISMMNAVLNIALRVRMEFS